MSEVFTGQSLLAIRLDTKYSGLASADVTQILYTKPNGDKGRWDAVVSGTKIVYNVQAGDIDQAGDWKVEAYFEVSGATCPCGITSIYFKKPLL